MIIEDRLVLAGLVSELKKQGEKIVFTNGCFDLIHPGHIKVLRMSKTLGDVLIVGVNTDESIRKLKGGSRPILSLNQRLEVLDSIKYVDIIVPFSEDTPDELIKIIKPDIHTKGEDYKNKDVPERKLVEQFGGKTIILKSGLDMSTTKIIKRIQGD